MTRLLPVVSTDYIRKILSESGKSSQQNEDLIEMDASSNLLQARKRFFRLHIPGEHDIHLSYGEDLKDLYERSKVINKVLPHITCKPILMVEDGDRQLFGQEYFDGLPIDQSFDSGHKNKDEISDILEKIKSTLSTLERPSTQNAMNEEFQQFCKTLLSNEYLPKFDSQYLLNVIFPKIKKSLNHHEPTVRWSTGDLAARNILVDQDSFKIIDFEFAKETHFHDEDWVRLKKYSTESFKNLDFIKRQFQGITSGIVAFSNLRQINLNKMVHSQKACSYYNSTELLEALRVFESENQKFDNDSLLLDGFIREKKERNCMLAQETDLRIQKEAELTQETDLRIQKEAELAHETDLRIQKESELAREKNVSKKNKFELEQSLDKVRRMQSSFSWKVTAPVRFLRRQKEKLFKDFLKTFNHHKHPIASAHSKQKKEEKSDHNISPFELADAYSTKPGIRKLKCYDPNCLKIVWLIPDFGIGSGGHTTIFRTIKWLEQFGHNSKIYICGKTHHQTKKKAKNIIKKYFFDINADLEILIQPSLFEEDTDIIVSTSYETCYFSRAITSDATRFYFVQDYEPDFAPLGSYYFLAKQTYNFGFRCITAGKWLASKIESVGGEVSCYFELAVDKSIFFPRVIPPKDKKNRPRIAIYARSGTPRRLTEISIFALNILAKRNLEFCVSFFGETSLPIYANFQHEILGILDSKSLSKLYCSSDLGCVFSGTNYSLVPLEMMACGLPLVEFDGKNTRETYPEDSVFFSKPDPLELANVIETALSNTELSIMVRKNALNFIKNLSWEKSIRQIEKGFLQV